MDQSSLKNFGFTYEYEGKSFVFHIAAGSAEEAIARQASMAGAEFEGVLLPTLDDGAQAVADKAKMLGGVSERLGLPLDGVVSPELQDAIANVRRERIVPATDALLFELRAPSGERWAIHLDGRFEGFPDGTFILNYAMPLVNCLLGEMLGPVPCASSQQP